MPVRRWNSPLRRVLVQGPSMAPALRHGDHLLAWMRPPTRARAGAVVLVELPGAGIAVKRLVRAEPDGSVWVEGDNPFGSTDSRTLGAVPRAALRGRVLARMWPRPALVRSRPAPSGPSAA